jgi:hypothetical protein
LRCLKIFSRFWSLGLVMVAYVLFVILSAKLSWRRAVYTHSAILYAKP